MTLKHSFFILMLLLGLSASAAVPAELRGKVTDAESGQALQGVVIRGIDRQGKASGFTSSAANGTFTLKIKAGVDSVSFRRMGYETVHLPLGADFSTVALFPTSTLLKEVIVKAPDIYAKGDTLVFNVDRYARPEDNAIIDIIKRLPGIKVEDDGTIKYQGKPINKFYLDGNDFIGGQYGLATENISHKDVKSVEVMENHQPIKALEGLEFPEEAGINLKLKEDARSRWVGYAEAATGFAPLLYRASAFAMRIAPKIQNLLTLKADNSGWDPETQIIDHDTDWLSTESYSENIWPDYISADIIGSPLPGRRTRDNDSWLANTITSWKKGDTALRLKLNYAGDFLKYRTQSYTDYLSQSIAPFLQKNVMSTRSHDLEAQLRAETNRRDYYLNNNFSIKASRDDAASGISGTETLSQDIGRRNISAVNSLRLVKRNDRRVFTINSRTSFRHASDRLAITDDESVLQRIVSTDFRSKTETDYGRIYRYWKASINAGVDINYHRLDAALDLAKDYDGDRLHNAFIAEVYLRPRLEYVRNAWRASLSSLIKWSHYSIHGAMNFPVISPALSLRRQLSAKSELLASANYALTPPAPALFIDQAILTDYRNIYLPLPTESSSSSTGAALTYRYRNPLNALFANLTLAYNHSRSPLSPEQIFKGNMIITTFARQRSHTDMWSVSGGVSKGLMHSRIVTGLDFNASRSSSAYLHDGERYDFRQSTVQLTPYFKSSLTSYLSLNYELKFTYSNLRIKCGEDADNSSALQRLGITLIPKDPLQFTLGAEYYYNRFSGSRHAQLTLFDLSAVWKVSSKVRLQLEARNLLDQREYRYVLYGSLSTSEHSYRLRPRNILASIQVRF